MRTTTHSGVPRPRSAMAVLAVVALGLAACRGDDLNGPEPTLPEQESALSADVRAPSALANSGARTWFVNAATGSNTNPGTSGSPLKTLGKALSVAASGDTVRLAKGCYSSTGCAVPSGDVYPLHVKSGLVIRGTRNADGSQATFLSPAASADRTTGLIFDGSAKVQDLQLTVFGNAIDAAAGAVTLRNINFMLDRTSLYLHGTAQATVTKPYFYLGATPGTAGAFELTQKARLTLDSAEVDNDGTCVDNVGFRAGDSTQVTVKNTKLRLFPSILLRLYGASQTMLSNVDIVPTDRVCLNYSYIRADENARLVLADVRVAGNSATRSAKAFLMVQGRAIMQGAKLALSSYEYGIIAEQKAAIFLSYSTFDNHKYTAVQATPSVPVTVSHSTFSDNHLALDGWDLKLRTTKIYRGDEAIIARGGLVNLGTALDPGFNTFAASRLPEVHVYTEIGQTVYAIGNIWNANLQGANPDGSYSITKVTTGQKYTYGANFDLSAAVQTKEPNTIVLH